MERRSPQQAGESHPSCRESRTSSRLDSFGQRPAGRDLHARPGLERPKEGFGVALHQAQGSLSRTLGGQPHRLPGTPERSAEPRSLVRAWADSGRAPPDRGQRGLVVGIPARPGQARKVASARFLVEQSLHCRQVKPLDLLPEPGVDLLSASDSGLKEGGKLGSGFLRRPNATVINLYQ
jgi:hypothetical protein